MAADTLLAEGLAGVYVAQHALVATEMLRSNSLRELHVCFTGLYFHAEIIVELWAALQGNTSLVKLSLDLYDADCEGARCTALWEALQSNASLASLVVVEAPFWVVAAMGKVLRSNPSLNMLHRLFDKRIGFGGTLLLGDALRSRSSLDELALAQSDVGPKGAAILGEALRFNTSLRKLDLHINPAIRGPRGKCIGAEGAAALGRALRHNRTLQTLDLAANHVGTKGAVALGEALLINASLQTLALGCNFIGAEGAVALGWAIQHNHILQEVRLEDNHVGTEGAVALGRALQHNNTLLVLHLSLESIGSKGVIALGEALRMNTSLQKLHLSHRGRCRCAAAVHALAQADDRALFCVRK